MNGCAAAIILMWLANRQESLAGAAARIGAVEHGVVLGFSGAARLPRSWRRSSGCWPLRSRALEKPMAASKSKVGSARFSGAMPSLSRQKSSPSVHLLKANLMSNAVGSAFFDLGDGPRR